LSFHDLGGGGFFQEGKMKVTSIGNGYRVRVDNGESRIALGGVELAIVEFLRFDSSVKERMAEISPPGSVRAELELSLAVKAIDEARHYAALARIAAVRDPRRYDEEAGLRCVRSALAEAPDLRSSSANSAGRRLAGYAAVFHRKGEPGTEFQLGKNYVERIAPTAFARAIAERQDVRALFNHQRDHVLGRLSAGTLRLSVDARGLRYEIDRPDTQVGRDLTESVRRGDIGGSSIAFALLEADIVREGNGHVRILRDLELIDVSPVSFPAYEDTTVSVD
jgi:HK97 family phage prohead protease